MIDAVEYLSVIFNDVTGSTMPARVETIIPLEIETRATLPTAEAAYHVHRQPQTLLLWACKENGPIRPLRINGRLAWRVSDIKKLLGVA